MPSNAGECVLSGCGGLLLRVLVEISRRSRRSGRDPPHFAFIVNGLCYLAFRLFRAVQFHVGPLWLTLSLQLSTSRYQRTKTAINRTGYEMMAKKVLLPDGCSSEIPSVEPRGQLIAFRETKVLPDGEDGFKVVEQPYRAGCAAIQEDVFDRMADQAKRAKGVLMLTQHQVDAGRAYRALYEKVDAAGVKCSSTFDDSVGGSGRADFMDAFAADVQRLGWFRNAIGDGFALRVRVQGAHSMDRGSRASITSQQLIDSVCLADQGLSVVLRRNGWAAATKNIKVLRVTLCAILERMKGV